MIPGYSQFWNRPRPRESRFKTLRMRFGTMRTSGCRSAGTGARSGALGRTRTLTSKIWPGPVRTPSEGKTRNGQHRSDGNKKRGAVAKNYGPSGAVFCSGAALLSKKRRAASKKLEGAVERELKSLAMPQARFTIEWTDVTPGRASGIDRPELLISPNPGEDLGPLEKIASGGEFSRVMLAFAHGTGGRSAATRRWYSMKSMRESAERQPKRWDKLKELSARYQILCVTHLAQIAAFAGPPISDRKVVLDGQIGDAGGSSER